MKRITFVLLAVTLMTSLALVGCSLSSQPVGPNATSSKTDRSIDAPPGFYDPPVHLEIASGSGSVSRRMDLSSQTSLTVLLEASADFGESEVWYERVTGEIRNSSNTTVAYLVINEEDFNVYPPETQQKGTTVTLSAGTYTVYLHTSGLYTNMYDMSLDVTVNN